MGFRNDFLDGSVLGFPRTEAGPPDDSTQLPSLNLKRGLNLRLVLCALAGHRYRSIGATLGTDLERCDRCLGTRTKP